MTELWREVERLQKTVRAVRLADRSKVVEVVRQFLDDLQAGRVELEALRQEIAEAKEKSASVQGEMNSALSGADDRFEAFKQSTSESLAKTDSRLQGLYQNLFTEWSAAAAKRLGRSDKIVEECLQKVTELTRAMVEHRESTNSKIVELGSAAAAHKARIDAIQLDLQGKFDRLHKDVARRIDALQQYERLNRAALAQLAKPEIDKKSRGWIKRLLGK